jgi:nucleoside-diphosphate-sugar epimerase
MTSRVAIVTGASGFIGRRLCQHLRDQAWRVHAITHTRIGRGSWDVAVCADLARTYCVDALARELPMAATALFHVAGRAHVHNAHASEHERQAFQEVNVRATEHVVALATALSVGRIVHVSSVAVMGETGDEIVDETYRTAPTTDYGRTKLEAECVVARASSPHVVLRFPMVFGGADRGNLFRMVDAVRRRRFPPFPETGNRRSMLHVEDAASALHLAATHPSASGQTFIVTDGAQYSTRQIYEAILDALGRARPRFTPPLAAYVAAAKLGDVLGRVAGRRMPLDTQALAKLSGSAAFSNARIVAQLGFRPQHTLSDGIRSILEEQTDRVRASE